VALEGASPKLERVWGERRLFLFQPAIGHFESRYGKFHEISDSQLCGVWFAYVGKMSFMTGVGSISNHPCVTSYYAEIPFREVLALGSQSFSSLSTCEDACKTNCAVATMPESSSACEVAQDLQLF
jgi:hypothetical protein